MISQELVGEGAINGSGRSRARRAALASKEAISQGYESLSNEMMVGAKKSSPLERGVRRRVSGVESLAAQAVAPRSWEKLPGDQ